LRKRVVQIQKNIEQERNNAYQEGAHQVEKEHEETVKVEVEKLRVSPYGLSAVMHYMTPPD